ncbi:MAG: hypothetical protein M3N08_00665 [Pseudomonadota bacterium]|nr:hypothetical protein [Pseudomonadota bacterium]
MPKSRFTACAIVLAVAAMSGVASPRAHAQAPTVAAQPAPATNSGFPPLESKSFDQYPSFVEFSGAASNNGGMQFTLRCGYLPVNGKLTPDPTLNDMSVLNTTSNSYTRYQNINGKSVLSGPDASIAGGKQVVVEVVEGDGSVRAKSCVADNSTDTISACITAQPLMTASQVSAEGAAVQKQCESFLQKASINPQLFDAAKTAAYKKKLEAKLAAVEAP